MEQKTRQEQAQVERLLLPQRLLVFLTTSSILFLGFATLEDSFRLRIVVASIGIVVSILSFFHFYPIYTRLKCLETAQEKVASAQRKGIWKLFGGRIVGWAWFPFFFLALWICSLLATLYHWR